MNSWTTAKAGARIQMNWFMAAQMSLGPIAFIFLGLGHVWFNGDFALVGFGGAVAGLFVCYLNALICVEAQMVNMMLYDMSSAPKGQSSSDYQKKLDALKTARSYTTWLIVLAVLIGLASFAALIFGG